MAGLQALRKRLRSIRSTGQLAGAMRTAATAKYARVNRARSDFAPYAEACEDMLRALGRDGLPRAAETAPRDCLVLMGSNRGLCGGFNAELLRFFQSRLAERETPPLLIACSKKAAAFLREQGLTAEERLLSDVPDFSETAALSAHLRELYAAGTAARIIFVYPRFENMLTQTPGETQLLPPPEPAEAEETRELLYLPGREAVARRVAEACVDARVYALALENAAGAQAATLMAMRSACDNAAASAAELELTINRRRQAQVTAGVIETASGNLQQGE